MSQFVMIFLIIAGISVIGGISFAIIGNAYEDYKHQLNNSVLPDRRMRVSVNDIKIQLKYVRMGIYCQKYRYSVDDKNNITRITSTDGTIQIDIRRGIGIIINDKNFNIDIDDTNCNNIVRCGKITSIRVLEYVPFLSTRKFNRMINKLFSDMTNSDDDNIKTQITNNIMRL